MVRFGSWRKIPQWLAAVVFVGSLGAALTIRGLLGLSAPETAKPILADIFKAALLQTEIAENFEELQPYLSTLPPDEPLPVPGLPQLDITAGEATALGKDKLADRVAGEIAEKSYDKQLELPAESEINTTTVAPLGAIFSADAHRSISTLNTALWVLAFISGAIMVIFSVRFGRLAALGLGLVAGSAVPAAVYAVLPARIESMQDSTGGASLELQMLAPILESIKPVLENSQHLALQTLLAGAALIGAAIVGGVFFPRKTPTLQPEPGAVRKP